MKKETPRKEEKSNNKREITLFIDRSQAFGENWTTKYSQ